LDGQTITVDGRSFRVHVERDEDAGAPWDNADVHGPVSDWRALDSKRAGERVLHRDRDSARFYDVREAQRIALRDQWGIDPKEAEGLTARQIAARAVEKDFDYLRAWCADEWFYVFVFVTLLDESGAVTKYRSAGIAGIESNAGDYLREVAIEEARELLAALPAKLDRDIARLQSLRASL
jgi:hypothetical protein